VSSTVSVVRETSVMSVLSIFSVSCIMSVERFLSTRSLVAYLDSAHMYFLVMIPFAVQPAMFWQLCFLVFPYVS
jgi:ABC-type amino acid transport system permease subunit